MKKVTPAILAENVVKLQHNLGQVEGLDAWVQVDITDGKFVDNTSVSLEDFFRVKLAESFSMEIEMHLMVLHPQRYFLLCQENNVKRVVFHLEAGDTENILAEAKKYNFQIGLALNPETPVEKVLPFINEIDVVLVMSVNPGRQGQTFIRQTLVKIQELKKLAPRVKIEVDGGINLENIKEVSDAGADYMVVGSGLLQAENIQERFKELQSRI